MRSNLLFSLAALVLVLPACSGGDGGGGGTGTQKTPTTLRLDRTSLAVPDGDTTRVNAAVLDQTGQPIALAGGTTASWSTSDANVATVEGQGLTARIRGARRGTAKVRVEAGSLRDSVTVTVTPVATAMSYVKGDGQEGSSGSPLADSAVVRVVDRNGEAVDGVTVTFAVTEGGGSVNPASAVTDAQGHARTQWTLGAQGANVIRASLASLPPVAFNATARAGTAVSITAITPATMVPGSAITITGSGFGSAAGTQVVIDGVTAAVSSATATQIVATVPARSALTCRATGPVAVSVKALATGSMAARAHPLQVAIPNNLAVGQSAVLSAQEQICVDFPQGGRYVMSVYNGSTTQNSSASYRLTGGGAGVAASPSLSRAPRRSAAPPAGMPALDESKHARILDANRALVQRLGAPRRPAVDRNARGSLRRSVQAAGPAVGDTMRMRVPNINSNTCTAYIEILARVAYSGTRAVMLEDAAAPLAGTMDTYFQLAGQEMDTRMWNVLRGSFGDPLAFDANLDGDGRVKMVFSPTVNNFGGVAGFVTSADFYPRTTCPASNEGETFYATVPTAPGTGYSGNTADNWFRTMRSTMIHEVKHITAYSEKFARAAPLAPSLEESWLEESTARLSEEFWARTYFGYAQGGNVEYANSVYCEVRPSNAACSGNPYVMFKHFSSLYDYLENTEVLTPLGRGVPGDATFYASGWSLVRWAVDNYGGANESAFVQSIIQETANRGYRNLEVRTGRSYGELLADWSLALAVDDYPGLTPANPRHKFNGWNLPNMFAGLNQDFPSGFTKASPLNKRVVAPGPFATDVGTLRWGSASIWEIPESATERPAVGIRGMGGTGTPAPTVGMAVIRVK